MKSYPTPLNQPDPGSQKIPRVEMGPLDPSTGVPISWIVDGSNPGPILDNNGYAKPVLTPIPNWDMEGNG